jgi:hypothetical protein
MSDKLKKLQKEPMKCQTFFLAYSVLALTSDFINEITVAIDK